jgi:1-acyl-sn-glycerol-3-phosphate acyltransferase
MRPLTADPIAQRSPRLLRFFGGVMAHQMRRNFHAVRLAKPGLPELPQNRPVIIYTNHPSWWDPAFIILLAARHFSDRPGYGPIDSAQLYRYPFLARLGVFGIEPGGARGGMIFLRTGLAILDNPRAMLWITAEGNFTDARTRPVRLRPGLAHLVRRVPHAAVLPFAIEYPFWNERSPEALGRFGPVFEAGTLALLAADQVTDILVRGLEATMDSLATDAMARDPSRFVSLLSGRVGVGGVYDVWRRLRANAAGEPFHAGHGLPE